LLDTAVMIETRNQTPGCVMQAAELLAREATDRNLGSLSLMPSCVMAYINHCSRSRSLELWSQSPSDGTLPSGPRRAESRMMQTVKSVETTSCSDIERYTLAQTPLVVRVCRGQRGILLSRSRRYRVSLLDSNHDVPVENCRIEVNR
jgi:hypothetical protein